jgi:hypothetical protein
MSLQFDTTLRNTWLAALTTALGATATLVIYSGSAPASCAASATGTLLATETLSNPAFPAPSAGAMSLSGVPLSVNAAATGTAGYFRLLDGSSVCHCQGVVGTSGADMNFNTVSFVSGAPVIVTSFTLTAPGP